ncbi:MAG TPA: alkaline phosphatase family protein [Mycobacteriales bacterium]|nr:alkaline phosphatase family protein [Mycobacteriales bacterium]
MTAAGSLETMRDLAVDVLCDDSLAHVVDLVAYVDGDSIVTANASGASRLSRADLEAPAEVIRGRDPVATQDPLAFSTLADELADPSPPNERNSYPWAAERLTSLFAAPAAPDLAVVHTGRHYFPDRRGHRGEHGSLSVVQSRAPLILSGPDVIGRGTIPVAARVIDVAPTLAWLSGVSLATLGDMDGQALVDLLVPRPDSKVVGLLWDGCNANSLYALAASGELPSVARLLSNGCALSGGAIAEFPSVTLVNHTCALTGVGPGRHGIVNNEYFDRAAGLQRLTNEPRTWHRWAEWLSPGVRTVFERIDALTACVNEPADAGASYSTFDLVRASGDDNGVSPNDSRLPSARDDAHASQEYVGSDGDYAWSSSVDAIGLTQMLDLWPSASEAPRLTWWNTLLTDTGHHAGGPHTPIAHASMRDADRRLGVFLDHLERIGALESTTFVLTADHGSEGADPDCRGDWDVPLRAAGVQFRDEAFGFIYLGV